MNPEQAGGRFFFTKWSTAALVIALSFLPLRLAVAQDSPHGKISVPCEACHTPSSWTEMKTPSGFDHSKTAFALVGQHAQVACKQCHADLRFAGSSTRCVDCHADIHRGELGADCARCHTPASWLVPDMPARHVSTSFPLFGAHLTAPCRACHVNEQKHEYVGVSMVCYSCHRTQYDATVAPAHRQAGFGTDCTQCHSLTALHWDASFDHANTAFPLLGAHRAVACSQCHVGNRFRGTPVDCYACHQPDYIRTTNPKHAPGLPTQCIMCHTPTAWSPSSFDHNRTSFPLTGEHHQVPCASCHANGVYAGTPQLCASCHLSQYNATSNPAHGPAGFSTDCKACHTTLAWTGAVFNHNQTAFPLTGAHIAVPCASCHVSGIYAGTTQQCVGCHQSQYNATTNPAHAAGGFPTACQTCHSTTAWSPASFDHNQTAFPLTGAHSAVPCASCHINGVYTGTSQLCVSCHQSQYNATTSPAHAAGGFPTTCQTCHSTIAWSPASFDHSKTAFPLTGAHMAVQCASCHVNGVYAGTPQQCVSCHQSQYNATTNPPHASGGFSTACQSCHTTAVWSPSTFDHSKVVFPLAGAHIAVPCASCHTSGPFAATPQQCVSCHLSQFNATANPPHASGGFSTACQTCHTTTVWSPSTFDHSKVAFPLTGAHVSVACASCHVSGPFAATSQQCVSCHLTQYNATTNPAHAAAGFPTDCTTCHTTTAWTPSTFQHNTFFPISAGSNHAPGRWTLCADCHTVPTDFRVFACINCHEHSQANTDAQHRGRANYQYNSQACYSCHPRGNGG